MKLKDFELRDLKPLALLAVLGAFWLGRNKPPERLTEVVGKVMDYPQDRQDNGTPFIHSYMEREVTFPRGRKGIAKVGLWDYEPYAISPLFIGESDGKNEDTLDIRIMDGSEQVGYISDVGVDGYARGIDSWDKRDTLEGDLTYQEMVDMVLDGRPVIRESYEEIVREEVSFEA